MDDDAKLKKILSEVEKKTRKEKWPCFFPGCIKKAVESHSQAKSSSLKNIDVDGHVIERDFSIFPPRATMGWKKIGINKATTFPGFCNHHDTKLFHQADSLGAGNLNQKPLTMLSFRTFALEMRKKEIWADAIRRVKLRLNKIPNPAGIVPADGLKEGMDNCLRVTKPHVLDKYHGMIFSNDFSLMTHNVFKSSKNLGISCSTVINPVPVMEWPLDIPQPTLTFNVLPRRDYTLVILSFFKSDSKLLPGFIEKYSRLENLVFNFCEEITFNPSLFKSLNSKILDIIDAAQVPWMTWIPISVPNIFNFTLDQDSLLTEI